MDQRRRIDPARRGQGHDGRAVREQRLPQRVELRHRGPGEHAGHEAPGHRRGRAPLQLGLARQQVEPAGPDEGVEIGCRAGQRGGDALARGLLPGSGRPRSTSTSAADSSSTVPCPAISTRTSRRRSCGGENRDAAHPHRLHRLTPRHRRPPGLPERPIRHGRPPPAPRAPARHRPPGPPPQPTTGAGPAPGRCSSVAPSTLSRLHHAPLRATGPSGSSMPSSDPAGLGSKAGRETPRGAGIRPADPSSGASRPLGLRRGRRAGEQQLPRHDERGAPLPTGAPAGPRRRPAPPTPAACPGRSRPASPSPDPPTRTARAPSLRSAADGARAALCHVVARLPRWNGGSTAPPSSSRSRSSTLATSKPPASRRMIRDDSGGQPAGQHAHVPQDRGGHGVLGLAQGLAGSDVMAVRAVGEAVDGELEAGPPREVAGRDRPDPPPGHRPGAHGSGHPPGAHVGATGTARSSARAWSSTAAITAASARAGLVGDGRGPRLCAGADRPGLLGRACLRRGRGHGPFGLSQATGLGDDRVGLLVRRLAPALRLLLGAGSDQPHLGLHVLEEREHGLELGRALGEPIRRDPATEGAPGVPLGRSRSRKSRTPMTLTSPGEGRCRPVSVRGPHRG